MRTGYDCRLKEERPNLPSKYISTIFPQNFRFPRLTVSSADHSCPARDINLPSIDSKLLWMRLIMEIPAPLLLDISVGQAQVSWRRTAVLAKLRWSIRVGLLTAWEIWSYCYELSKAKFIEKGTLIPDTEVSRVFFLSMTAIKAGFDSPNETPWVQSGRGWFPQNGLHLGWCDFMRTVLRSCGDILQTLSRRNPGSDSTAIKRPGLSPVDGWSS